MTADSAAASASASPGDSGTAGSGSAGSGSAGPAPEILAAFEAAKGFMPVHEGLALYAAATEA